MWNAHNTVFGRKRSAICAQTVYFLYSTMPSAMCLRHSDVSITCLVTYFQFTIQSAFLPCQSARQHRSVLGLPNIGHRTMAKIWVGTFLYRAYSPREWLWIDSNGNKLAPYGTDGRLFATDVSANFKSLDTKTRPNMQNPAWSNLDIVP